MISKNRIKLSWLFFATLLLSTTFVRALPAFPGAQGGGAASVGGRGGVVIAVTNLNDSGPGSLRACAIDASGPRTCVFRVGGIIYLASTLYVTHPYLTVAGQTAPGGGITLSGQYMTQHMVTIDTNDVIWRYTRIRHGYNAANVYGNGINFSTEGPAYNVIFDHNSLSWSQDDDSGGDISRDTSIMPLNSETFSWNLIAEPLAGHPTTFVFSCENGGTTTNWCDAVTDIDLHHNLIMNNSHRNPLVNFKSGRWVNNIVYNAGFYYTSIGAGVNLDAIGNLYKQGPLFTTYWGTPNKIIHEFEVSRRPCAGGTLSADNYCATGNPSLYLLGNMGPNQANPAGNQWAMANMVSQANQPETGPVPTTNQRNTPLPATTYPIIADPVTNLDTVMLPAIGASQRLACDGTWVSNRDSVDARLISEYQNNLGLSYFLNSENDVGGYPTVAAGTACTSTAGDGIPDVWKTARGFSVSDATVGNKIAANGYTNIENFLNGVVSPASSLPDLIAISLAYDSTSHLFTSVVKNQGAGPTPSGIVIGNGFYVDGTFVTWGDNWPLINPLAPGASVAIGSAGRGGPYILGSGTHTIMVKANDYGCCGRFPESNETNNTLSQIITVP